MTHAEYYIERCLNLASQARFTAKPNPMVGAVIVHDDQIIAEGFHSACGAAHAEIEALKQIKTADQLLEATLYVNLEPCNHYGRTPPCTDAIINSGIKTVVIGSLDSNPKTAGLGCRALRNAGINVTVGVCEEQCRLLNKRFYSYFEKQRPYIVLKWAETSDGFIARSDNSSKWISTELSRAFVHELRSSEQAIMVGAQTAQVDNPQLTARGKGFVNPVRIILDPNLRVPATHNVFDNTVKTIFLNKTKAALEQNTQYIKLAGDFWSPQLIAQTLFEQEIISVLIEGGRKTLQTFLDNNLWDEAYRFVSQQTFVEGIAAPKISATAVEETRLAEDQLSFYRNTSK